MAHPLNLYSSSFSSLPSASAPVIKKKSLADLLASVASSQVLKGLEKKLYTDMIQCTARYGLANDRELFNAAGYCFDMHFSPVNNITTIREYLSLMGEEKVPKTLGENEYIAADYLAHNRPGFFLLSSDANPYFIKEGDNGSLVYYDAEKDEFVDSSTIPVMGDEKMVIINKTQFPIFRAHYSHHTPNEPIVGKFYHEEQYARKCAIHAVHAFVGFPFINETLLSLIQLEKLVTDSFFSEIPIHHRIRNASQAELLLQTDKDHYKNMYRFKLAQTSLFQAELGASGEPMLQILKQMAKEGTIDSKYQNARMYSIKLTGQEIKYGKEQGLLLEGQDWTIDVATRMLDAVTQDLEKNKAQIDLLDQKIAKTAGQASLASDEEFKSAVIEREPFDVLKVIKEHLEDSIHAMKELETQFQRSDRLAVFSRTESHCFAFRKCENGTWIVLDSHNDSQASTDNPMKYLKERQMQFYQIKNNCLYEFITID